MGRAIVREPAVFLFDEPLSNLDAKLRAQMRVELAVLHKRLGKTTVYVTHDQIEAMTLADRIVILDRGVIQQIGTPEQVFNQPRNLFVAGFIGSPGMNLLPAIADGRGGAILRSGSTQVRWQRTQGRPWWLEMRHSGVWRQFLSRISSATACLWARMKPARSTPAKSCAAR